MKRSNTNLLVPINKKQHTSNLSGLEQLQKAIGSQSGLSMNTTGVAIKSEQVALALNDLSGITVTRTMSSNSRIGNSGISGTAIKVESPTVSNVTTPTTLQRTPIVIKREAAQRTMCSMTLQLIEKNPLQHLGIPASRLPLLKQVICPTSKVLLVDCYLTLKKLRQNEDFSLLADYFQMSEASAQLSFSRSICRLARYMRYLVCWPETQSFYDRHKNLPFAYRSTLKNVQSMIECVDTDIRKVQHMDCNNYKFILSVTPNGMISYISEAFVGYNDDLSVLKASNFQSVIPRYLSLMVDPGKAVRRKRKNKTKHNESSKKVPNQSSAQDSNTDSADEFADDVDTITVDEHGFTVGIQQEMSSYAAARIAGELASQQTLNVVDNVLISRNVKDITVPTIRLREPICRVQISEMIGRLREFKILQPYSIQEPMLYQFLNEILVVTAAITNINR